MSFSLAPISRPWGTAPDSSPSCTDCTSERSSSATCVSHADELLDLGLGHVDAEVVVRDLESSARRPVGR